METYEKWAVADCLNKAVKQETENLRMGTILNWPDKTKSMEVTVGNERVGTVTLARRESGYWEVVDREAFEPFARESLLTKTIVEVDISAIPADVIDELIEKYPGIMVIHEDFDAWQKRVTMTPDGPMLDTGEVVPGIEWVEDVTRYPLFTPRKGLKREDVLRIAARSGGLNEVLEVDDGRYGYLGAAGPGASGDAEPQEGQGGPGRPEEVPVREP